MLRRAFLAATDAHFDHMYRKWDATWQRLGERPRLDGVRFSTSVAALAPSRCTPLKKAPKLSDSTSIPNPIACGKSIAERRFSDLDITYTETPIGQLDGQFDVIMTNEVLEHVVGPCWVPRSGAEKAPARRDLLRRLGPSLVFPKRVVIT